MEGSSYENQHASRDWAFLGILVFYVVLDVLETEGLNLLGNLLKSLKATAIVGHGTASTIIVDERVAVLHDSVVVAREKLLTDCFHRHELLICLRIYINQQLRSDIFIQSNYDQIYFAGINYIQSMYCISKYIQIT